MTEAIPFGSLLIPSCPASEASEVARKLKKAATKRAWCRANPEKQRLYNRTYIATLKMKAAAVPAQPAFVEVTLSELVQQVAELRAEVDALKGSRRGGSGLLIEKVSPSITKPSNR